MLEKKNFFVEFSDCIICDEWPDETIKHLFCECSFGQSFWWTIGIKWNPDLDIHNMIIEAANRYSHNFMMEIILIGCWSIWEQRHDANFKGIYTYVQRCINR
jgi:hypothetical protein